MLNKHSISFFAGMFFLSGFAGLIYESIWSHYLKLFLGHAAYAQSLVICIFMGGMAAGAYLAAKYSKRWLNLIFVYAVVEAIIGLLALVFHESFDSFLQLAYSTILPNISSPALVQSFKWFFAGIFILPQTILLGMTFPLMTAGLIRFFPQNQGKTIALLYFTNSIGAALGVLVSGFLFIEWFGLPGTIKVAGLLNLVIAGAIIYALKKDVFKLPSIKLTDMPGIESSENPLNNRFLLILLLVSLGTGLASFIYEISWIRMLSLVLGSSTHAFELMLSAFILGIALGGLWLYGRIQNITDPIRYLANVQIIMGMLALATLPLYNLSFDVMQQLVSELDKDDQGYAFFNIISHFLALLIMLPATFCAGLTLPLITHILLGKKCGESSIGFVYAFNTVGAILGVLLCLHILLPLVGLQFSVTFGALLDISIGAALIYYFQGKKLDFKEYRLAAVAGFMLLFSIPIVDFDSYKMASGVYRHGNFYTSENSELLFHQDGKTASVDLVRVKGSNEISIITNGKPDASINVSMNGLPSPDEATMVLAAALPLSVVPESKTVAVIGLGSGLTSHVLLTAENLDQVDTIEIEPAIVEAAKGYQARVANVYNHPKSQIHIDDAKSFFSTQNKKYDIIISEPSNPWVSGVASLFTEEFYQQVGRHLSENGVFAQWLQLYEIDLDLISTITNAISDQFEDYQIYAANNQDVIILASPSGKIRNPSNYIFNYRSLVVELSRVRVRNLQDLQIRKLGGKETLDPFFRSYSSTVNSDYYPVLDLRAIKARFLQKNALQLITLVDDPNNFDNVVTGSKPLAVTTSTTPSRFFYPTDLSFVSMIMRDYLLYNRIDNQFYKLPDQFKNSLANLKSTILECNPDSDQSSLMASLNLVSDTLLPYLTSYESSSIWNRLISSGCLDQLPAMVIKKLHLLLAISSQDYRAISAISEEMLAKDELQPDVALLTAAMLGNIGLKEHERARLIYAKYINQVSVSEKSELLVRLLKSHSLHN